MDKIKSKHLSTFYHIDFIRICQTLLIIFDPIQPWLFWHTYNTHNHINKMFCFICICIFHTVLQVELWHNPNPFGRKSEIFSSTKTSFTSNVNEQWRLSLKGLSHNNWNPLRLYFKKNELFQTPTNLFFTYNLFPFDLKHFFDRLAWFETDFLPR